MNGHDTPSSKGTYRRLGALTRRRLLQSVGGTAVGSVLLGTLPGTASAAPAPGAIDWTAYIETPRTYAENVEPPTVPTSIPFGSLSSALSAERDRAFLSEQWLESEYVESLGGAWKFHFGNSLGDAATDTSNYENWDSVQVPHTWQTDGYGDLDYYNVHVGFSPNDPSNVPSTDNSVGTYRREFTVPSGWNSGRQTYLRVGAAKAGYFVWVNDQYVGYKQGSMTPGEFNLSDHVTEGTTNTVTIQVVRWTDGTYIEEQDMFRYAGIFRDVLLYSKPDLSVRDFAAVPALDSTYTDGTLSVTAWLPNAGETQQSATVHAHLYEPDGTEIDASSESVTVQGGAQGETTVEFTVTNVETWNAETPTLYTLGLEVVPNGQSSASEALVEKVGFRVYEILPGEDGSGDVFAVNGEPVTLTGVNKHAHSPLHGRHVSKETMLEDVQLLKQSNHNAVRLSHYPNHADFYRLCDEHGLYVQDEINAEAHANTHLSSDDSYEAQFVDRFRRMVDGHKNFASINIWSTGNEAGLGDAHYTMRDVADSIDGTRMLYHQANNGGTAPYADIVGPRYITPSDNEWRATSDDDPRPCVMGEYAHAMGNSGGLLQDHYDVINSYDTLQGGYIWDWVNQSNHLLRDPGGDEFLSEPHRTGAIEDQSIAGNHSTVHGTPSAVSGQSGSALEFDGSGDWVEVANGDSLDIRDELSVEVVVWGDTSLSGHQPFVVKGDTQYGLKMTDGDLQFFVYDGASWQTVTAAPPSGWDGTWHTVTGVYDGSTLRLYADGAELARTSFSGSIHSNHFAVGVGHNTEATDRYSGVTIDSARVFDRALSASEVASVSSPEDSTRLWLDFALRERYRFWDPDSPDQWFSLNGCVYSDRSTMPEFEQVKKAHQPVGFEPVDLVSGDIEMTNRHDFTNLSAFDVGWELTEDDTVLQSGTLDVAIAPGDTQTVTVGYTQPELHAGAEYFLNLSVTLSAEESWAPAGHEIALDQFEVPWPVPNDPETSLSEMGEVSYSTNESTVTVSGPDFTYVFDTSVGRFTSLQRYGEEFLTRGPEVNAWREPVLNERSNWGDAEADDWYAAGLDTQVQTVDSSNVSQPDGSAVRIELSATTSSSGNSEAFDTEYLYHVLASGDVVTRVRITPNAAMQNTVHFLPKYGLRMHLQDQFDTFEWFGRGPRETYPDKKWGQRIGRYSSDVSDQYVSYLPPSEYGNRCDTRYAAVTNDSEIGLLAQDLPETDTMNASVQTFTSMASVDYDYQLEYADGIVFNVDYDVTGVGGTPVSVRESYQVSPEPVEFVYALRPFDGASEDPLELSKRDLPYSETTIGTGGSGPIEDGTYRIEPVHSGLSLDVSGGSTSDGASVVQNSDVDADRQHWTVTETSSGVYTIENSNSGKLLDVEGGSTADGADVIQWTDNGGDNQRFHIEPDGSSYRIENVNSGKVLDVEGASTADGANVIQWTDNGGDNQRWQLSRV